jgi:hypothetical protein
MKILSTMILFAMMATSASVPVYSKGVLAKVNHKYPRLEAWSIIETKDDIFAYKNGKSLSEIIQNDLNYDKPMIEQAARNNPRGKYAAKEVFFLDEDALHGGETRPEIIQKDFDTGKEIAGVFGVSVNTNNIKNDIRKKYIEHKARKDIHEQIISRPSNAPM